MKCDVSFALKGTCFDSVCKIKYRSGQIIFKIIDDLLKIPLKEPYRMH